MDRKFVSGLNKVAPQQIFKDECIPKKLNNISANYINKFFYAFWKTELLYTRNVIQWVFETDFYQSIQTNLKKIPFSSYTGKILKKNLKNLGILYNIFLYYFQVIGDKLQRK